MSNHQRILRGISIGGTIVTAVLIVLLFASIFVSLTYNARSQARQLTPVSEAQGIQLQFDYPLYLFQQEAPTALHVNVWNNDTLILSEPLSVRLNIPEGIQVVTPTINANDRVVVLTFLPEDGAVQNGRVYLQNAGTVTITQDRDITVQSTLHPDIPPMGIEINSPWQAAIGSFFRNVLSGNGPLLLVITAAGTVMIQLLQHYQRQEEMEQKRERELQEQRNFQEELAQKREHELQEQRDLTALELALAERSHLIDMNPTGVIRTWLPLNMPDMRRRLPVHEEKWLVLLTTIATSNPAPDDQAFSDAKPLMVEIEREWPNELAGAIICAYKHAEKRNGRSENGDSQSAFKKWFKELDISRIDNLELRDEWIRIGFDLQQEIQYDVPNIEIELRPDTPISEDELFPPLAQIRAEDEEHTLYIKNAFWPGNPAYHEFVNHNDRNQIIFGVSGSGLTALAKGIWTNESRWTPYFWCYLPIYPGMEATLDPVNNALSRQLLKYVLYKPLRLTALEPYQRELLATVLVYAFSASSLCAQIERVKAQSPWLTEAPQEHKEEWRQVGKTQLTLLGDNILRLDNENPFTPYQWLHALVESYQSLGFEQLRLLFDFAPDTEELAQKMIYLWAEWQTNGVISTFFLPTPVKEKLKMDKNKIHQIELAWNTEQLDELIKHRYYRILQQRPAWRYIGGDPDKYKEFLDQLSEPLTPRNLVEKLPDIPFPKSSVAKKLLVEKLHDTPSRESSVVREKELEIGDGEIEQRSNFKEKLINPLIQSLIVEESTNVDSPEITSNRQKKSRTEMRREFKDWLGKRFILVELRHLCFDLAINIEDMEGSTQSEKVVSLIEYCERHELVVELIERCKDIRSKDKYWENFVPWESG